VCEAVHHVHRYGTAYRNLTTESVLQTGEESIKLRGVLDQFDEPDPWYNAPEEFDGESTERSTVYRIGLIAYELFTGELPYPEYPNGNPEAAVQDAKLRSLDEQLSDHSADVAATLEKALAHSPEDRYETVLHMRDAFEQI
jgi:Protein kinase domain.